MQPKNVNNKLDNGHTSVCGMSECGKTSATKKLLLKPTDQVAIFDPFGDYCGDLCGRVVRPYYDLPSFAEALIKGRKQNRGFKISLNLLQKPKNKEIFDAFCKVCWAVGDGAHKKPLKIVLEEVAQFSDAGKADGYHGQLLRVGRKFGLQTINIFQRGQEVSKTIFDNCKYHLIMMQQTRSSAKYFEDKLNVKADEIANLKKLQYILLSGKEAQRGTISWK